MKKIKEINIGYKDGRLILKCEEKQIPKNIVEEIINQVGIGFLNEAYAQRKSLKGWQILAIGEFIIIIHLIVLCLTK